MANLLKEPFQSIHDFPFDGQGLANQLSRIFVRRLFGDLRLITIRTINSELGQHLGLVSGVPSRLAEEIINNNPCIGFLGVILHRHLSWHLLPWSNLKLKLKVFQLWLKALYLKTVVLFRKNFCTA